MNSEVQMYWNYISESIERLLKTLDNMSEEQINVRLTNSANSLFVLGVHTLGNVEENCLEVLCGQEVGRNRDAEFLDRGTRDSVTNLWKDLQDPLIMALDTLTPESLDKIYDHPRRVGCSGLEILLLTSRHAAEHMGQAEITKDLLLAQKINLGPGPIVTEQ